MYVKKLNSFKNILESGSEVFEKILATFNNNNLYSGGWARLHKFLFN